MTIVANNADILVGDYSTSNIRDLVAGIAGIIQTQLVSPAEALSGYFSLNGRDNDFGLDVLAERLGFTRIFLEDFSNFFGFDEAGDTFDVSPFASSQGTLSPIPNQVLRNLIRMRALALISNYSVPSLDAAVQQMFPNAYYIDNLDMTMDLVLNEAVDPLVVIAITNANLFPKPAGVSLTVHLTLP